MEQFYLLELMIDTVCIFANENDTVIKNKNKKFVINVKFGPKRQFIIKENDLTKKPSPTPPIEPKAIGDDDIVADEIQNKDSNLIDLMQPRKTETPKGTFIPTGNKYPVDEGQTKVIQKNIAVDIDNEVIASNKKDSIPGNVPIIAADDTIVTKTNEIIANETTLEETDFSKVNNDPIYQKKDCKEDKMEYDDNGNKMWCRSIHVGKSYLFSSCPDKLLETLIKCPLEFEVWTDDVGDKDFVGIGTLSWNNEFYSFLKESANPDKLHPPLTVKQRDVMLLECCCARAGEISVLVRLSSLGRNITTEFQQLTSNDTTDYFTLRTNRTPTTLECKRVIGEDLNFCMIGSLYETVTLEDPDVALKARNKIEVCSKLKSCGKAKTDGTRVNQPRRGVTGPIPHTCKVEKIRMADIVGPCGNANCLLASKVKKFIRNTDAYKKATQGIILSDKNDIGQKCGDCICKDDIKHRDTCPEVAAKTKRTKCGASMKSDTTKKSLFGSDFIVNNCQVRCATIPENSSSDGGKSDFKCCPCVDDKKPSQVSKTNIGSNTESNTRLSRKSNKNASSTFLARKSGSSVSFRKNSTQQFTSNNNTSHYETSVYNAEVKPGAPGGRVINNFCTDIPDDKECKCNPPHTGPPCNTFDCDCLNIARSMDSRKRHKPYCPLFKHKANCPVTMMNDEEENKNELEEVEEVESLPYGLPPIQLGPCPVLGRPCSVPDGFARMYKTAVQPTQPPSYSDAGKVCCSKEFERIKKALKEYMTVKKGDDFRCINKFYVDTERRCCDKEQRLMNLFGRSCCGSHKLALNEKFKEDKERQESEKRNQQ